MRKWKIEERSSEIVGDSLEKKNEEGQKVSYVSTNSLILLQINTKTVLVMHFWCFASTNCNAWLFIGFEYLNLQQDLLSYFVLL